MPIDISALTAQKVNSGIAVCPSKLFPNGVPSHHFEIPNNVPRINPHDFPLNNPHPLGPHFNPHDFPLNYPHYPLGLHFNPHDIHHPIYIHQVHGIESLTSQFHPDMSPSPFNPGSPIDTLNF